MGISHFVCCRAPATSKHTQREKLKVLRPFRTTKFLFIRFILIGKRIGRGVCVAK